MVHADHSSSCGFVGYQEEFLHHGGAPCGWIIRFSNQGQKYSIYHAGDTGIFGDMALIDEMYKPSHIVLPIGGIDTMGPEEAAYAVQNFFKNAHMVIPMHFGTHKSLKGT